MIQMLNNYVDGRWVEPQHAGLLDVINPSTGLQMLLYNMLQAAGN